jgi:repressor LexA
MMARQRRKGISERQKKILEMVDKFQRKAGYPPAIREICNQTGISSTSVVNYYLDQLQEMGYIERDEGVSRGIRLQEPAYEIIGPVASAAAAVRLTAQNVSQAVAEMLQIPLVGRIAAGAPMPLPSTDFSYYDPDSMVDVASSLLPKGERGDGLFALEVKGESMIDAMVYDGDIVILKPAVEARNGEMVAVWLNDVNETTLKYFYNEKEKGRVRLQPANPTMQPIYINDPKNVEVKGKVVMVIRKINGLVA